MRSSTVLVCGILGLGASVAQAQPWQLLSQSITFSYPSASGMSTEVITPSLPGAFPRTGNNTLTVGGFTFEGEGVEGIISITGTTTPQTTFTSTEMSMSVSSTLVASVLDQFEGGDYPQLGRRIDTLIEMRFRVLTPLQVNAARLPAPNYTEPSWDSVCFPDFSPPWVGRLNAAGEVIQNSTFGPGYGNPIQTLIPGDYFARIRTGIIYSSGSFGAEPRSANSSIIDGAQLVIIPAPGMVCFLIGLGFVSARRRR